MDRVDAVVARAEFEFSPAQLEDVYSRGSGPVLARRFQRAVRRSLVVIWLIVVGVALWLQAPLDRLSAMVAIGLVLAWVWDRYRLPRITAKTVATAVRRAVQKAFGDATSARCVVALSAAGLTVDQMGHSFRCSWSQVHSIEELDGDVEFHGPGLVVVRRSAFATDAEQVDFLAQARALHTAAVSSAA